MSSSDRSRAVRATTGAISGAAVTLSSVVVSQLDARSRSDRKSYVYHPSTPSTSSTHSTITGDLPRQPRDLAEECRPMSVDLPAGALSRVEQPYRVSPSDQALSGAQE